MKQRILTAVVGLSLMAIVLVFLDTVLFNIVIAIVSAIGVWEMLASDKTISSKPLKILCLACGIAIPFLGTEFLAPYRLLLFVLFFFFLFAIYLLERETVRFQHLAMAFFAGILIPLGLSCFVFLRDNYPKAPLIYILTIFAAAWLADIGGLFVGALIGKHKFAPKISPKKTIEGVVGGLVFGTFGTMGIVWLLTALPIYNVEISVQYLPLGIAAFLAACISIFGDLCFSLIKRQAEIKDFGKLMPGHGGVLDRFDSILFAAPFFLVVFDLFPSIIAIAG